ncbi:hypothetical protein FOZ63_000577 [Perkinsus olseni]|uniref:Uncharacterized protein n=1 Tax=Perkinsus olseni TaxID=32597 RepID=A0A7J6RL92_PEROL|nr:hypothetical protein FOZ63_000577 [Perkinsus olseni]KAF4739077.1 hypothetical protein FOZ62_000389 [Perkinsus olseni]
MYRLLNQDLPVGDVPRVALLTRRGSCHFGPDITYAKLFQAGEEGAFAFDLSENADLLGKIISTLTFDRSPRQCALLTVATHPASQAFKELCSVILCVIACVTAFSGFIDDASGTK